MTLGRSFLLWILGVLVLTMVMVSSLVLWHEQRILEEELRSRGELLAQILALTAAEGGSPEYLAIVSMTDVRAGEVRDESGQVLYRYGPFIEEIESLDASALRIEQQVQVGRGPWGGGDAVNVVLLVSRARIRTNLSAAAIRLLASLGFALAVVLVVGLGLIGQVVRPLRELAVWVRAFDPDKKLELPAQGKSVAEVRQLAGAFSDMAVRLVEQRDSLVSSERRFRELFASSPTPLLRLDQYLDICDANPAAEVFLGRSLERSLGRSLAAYLDGLSVENLATAVALNLGASETVLSERWCLGTGELAEIDLHIRSAGSGEQAGYLAAIHDLTERVQRMGERWRRTFDAMVDGVALVDTAGEMTLRNRALEPYYEAVAKGLDLRIQANSPQNWRTTSAGRLLQCSLSSPEGIEHAILVVRDITEAEHSEQRLREAEKMQAVGTLASGVAHDFNNLLAAILLHARLIQQQPAAAAEASAAIRELAEQGSEVVGELLLFARRETKPPTTIDLVELVRCQEGVFHHMLTAGIELEFDLEPEVVPVVGDAVALRRLLLNLVVNARDAVAEDGGQITIRVEHTPGRAVLEISDNGPGIPDEVREHLFEPFFTMRRQGRGSGLGLAVVYGIVTGCGGEIDVRSEPGEGARFIVRLPLGDVAELDELSEPGARTVPETRILLVEADGRSAAGKIEVLANAGMAVRHASSLQMAASLADQWAPTVVVIGDSKEECPNEWLRDLRIPAVVLTAQDTDTLSLGPSAIRLDRSADPEKILQALRDLGVVPRA